jgi:hypothetical protein
MNLHPKYVLTIPFIGSIAIVLNLYNGDILGISCNFEYILWYIFPLIYFIFHTLRHYYKSHYNNKWEKIIEFSLEMIVCLLAIIFNVYWHYAWIKDAKTNYRHRTEYYDTQCLLSSMLYSILHTQFHKDLDKYNRRRIGVINI